MTREEFMEHLESYSWAERNIMVGDWSQMTKDYYTRHKTAMIAEYDSITAQLAEAKAAIERKDKVLHDALSEMLGDKTDGTWLDTVKSIQNELKNDDAHSIAQDA